MAFSEITGERGKRPLKSPFIIMPPPMGADGKQGDARVPQCPGGSSRKP
jgi:hypothetical protein